MKATVDWQVAAPSVASVLSRGCSSYQMGIGMKASAFPFKTTLEASPYQEHRDGRLTDAQSLFNHLDRGVIGYGVVRASHAKEGWLLSVSVLVYFQISVARKH